MNHVVVTGAAGFIGRHVVSLLLERGHTVVGIDRRSWTPVPGEHALVADLTEHRVDVASALREAAAVAHLAGRPGVRDTTPDIDSLRHRDNVLATEAVLTHVPLDVPIAATSSSSVYGGTPDGRPSREDDPLLPRGGYARSKLLMERCCEVRRERGGHVGVVRPFTVAGPGQRPDMALARWITAAREGRPLTILGDAGRRRDITDVIDVAEGIVRMLEREVTATVNLGTGSSHRLVDLVGVVADVLGIGITTTEAPAHPVEAASTRADVARCRRLLGFVPRNDIRSLVARQAASALELVEAA